jgi:hypothetical protein
LLQEVGRLVLEVHFERDEMAPHGRRALAGSLRLDVQGEPLYRANVNKGSPLDSTLRAGLPSFALQPDPAPRPARLDDNCAQPKESGGANLRCLPLRPPKAVEDGDDFPNHRDSEADTVPRMREQEEKNKPDQQRKHRSFVPEDLAPVSWDTTKRRALPHVVPPLSRTFRSNRWERYE